MYKNVVHLGCKSIFMNKITISELRSNLKGILEEVKQGKEYQVTQRGKIIVSLIKPIMNENEDFQKRLESYRNGGIKVTGDIVNAPLKEFDYVDDSMYNSPPYNPSIAAEPDA